MKKPVVFVINEAAEKVVSCETVNVGRNGFVTAEGVLQVGEKENRNRRFYSTEDLHSEIYSDRIRELVTTGNFKGEAGHPLDLNLSRQQKVDGTLEQVWFTKLWMEGPLVKAQFRGTNNELGRSFNEDLKDGQLPSFSLRSIGSIKNNGGRNQVTNLRIICYDRVYFPSYPDAYTDHIVTESAFMDDLKLTNMNEDMKRKIVESGNSLMVESAVSPIINDDVRKVIMKESYNLNAMCEAFDQEFTNITRKGNNLQLVDENYNVIVVPIEDYVGAKIDKFCDRF
jgi:prohead core protein protease